MLHPAGVRYYDKMDEDEILIPPTALQILSRAAGLFRQFIRQATESEWVESTNAKERAQIERDFAGVLADEEAVGMDDVMTPEEHRRVYSPLGTWSEDDHAASNISALALPTLLWSIGLSDTIGTTDDLLDTMEICQEELFTEENIKNCKRRDEVEIDVALEEAQDAYESLDEEFADEAAAHAATEVIATAAALEWICGMVDDWDSLWTPELE